MKFDEAIRSSSFHMKGHECDFSRSVFLNWVVSRESSENLMSTCFQNTLIKNVCILRAEVSMVPVSVTRYSLSSDKSIICQRRHRGIVLAVWSFHWVV